MNIEATKETNISVDSKKESKKPKEGSNKPKKTIFKHTQDYKEIKKQKNNDGLMRMSYLYKIAEKFRNDFPGYSWKYMHDMNQVSEKLVIRTDNQTKQDICKICRGLISKKPLNQEQLFKGYKYPISRSLTFTQLENPTKDYIEQKCDYCGEVRKRFLKPKSHQKTIS